MKKVYTLPAPARIAAMKKDHGQLHKLSVVISDTEMAICILRHPRMEDITMSVDLGDEDDDKQSTILFQNCWLEGDERIMKVEKGEFVIENAGLFLSAARQALTLFQVLQYEVEDEGDLRIIKITKEDGTVLTGIFKHPSLLTVEKASKFGDFLQKGQMFILDCKVDCPPVFIDESDHEISFAVYMAGHMLLKRYAAKVEKL